MAYIGNSPALKYASFAVQHFTTSATTSYSLDNSVANENELALFINNVRQQPGGSYAYTAAGTTLTLSAATTSSDTMYCVFIGKAVQTVVPPDGSVDSAQLATDAVTTVKITDTNVTGAKLNDDAISAQDALGAAPADTDEFLVSDAGVLKRVDYSYIKGITQTSFLPTANPLMYNANMSVNQRGDSTGLTGHGYHSVDRFGTYITSGGTWSQSLAASSLGLQGFPNSLLMDNTTANGSLSANSDVRIYQDFEGQDLQLLKKGTANAEKITIAFWVYGTKTGTHIVELYDGNGRTCSQSYTISSTNTWEHKVVNFPADTSGTLADDNTQQLSLIWWLCAGTDYTSGSLQTTWASVTAANRAVGQVNCADSTSNNWQITGVQMEVGEYTSSDLPPFRHESFGDNMARCQRYYQSNYRDGVYPGASTTNAGTWSGAFYGTDFLTQFTLWQVRMRTNPTITFYTRTGTAGSWYAGVYQVNEAVDTVVSSINTPTGWQATVSGVASNTDVAYGYYVGDAEL